MPEPELTTGTMFGSDEILFFNNGRWGEAGYAIPNPGVEFVGNKPKKGKLWTSNMVLFQICTTLGSSMFELMHREDVKFSRPPNVQFLFDVYQMCIVARKRLADRAIDFNDPAFQPMHATPAPQVFPCFPVPYFGTRIRQQDAREWCQLTLLCMSELMQHSDNDYVMDISTTCASRLGQFINRILTLLATKYLGFTREQITADFTIEEDVWKGYDPSNLFLSMELTEERPPLQYWPTENDLSKIRGIPITDALVFAERWPITAQLLEGYPAPLEELAQSGQPTGGSTFLTPPGQAPT